jgi:hypothetical protein
MIGLARALNNVNAGDDLALARVLDWLIAAWDPKLYLPELQKCLEEAALEGGLLGSLRAAIRKLPDLLIPPESGPIPVNLRTDQALQMPCKSRPSFLVGRNDTPH